MRPIRNPKSPILFKIKALFPAFDADFFSDQKDIKRYELNPTSSHPKNITKKFPDITSSNIEKTKKLKYSKYFVYFSSLLIYEVEKS